MRFFTIFLALATSVFANEVASVDMSFGALYANAHIVVKCVIVILVGFSVLSWSIFLAKYLHFRFAFNRLENDKEQFLRLSQINQDINLDSQSFLSGFLSIAKSQIDNKHRQNERIKELIDLSQKRTLNLMRSYIGILASIGSSAPFIGLFGTVWGIMNSFIGIASANNASLAVVAPGIAEALFATALGLAAAIPAVLIYNCLVRMNAKFKDELNELATKVYALAIREIV